MAQELTWKASIDPAIAKAALADVRREIAQTVQASQNANKSELTMRQQIAAAQSLQRQRSAALVAEWKRTERAAADLAKGVSPVKENLQRITDVMQALGSSSAALTGPLGGVAGRLRSLGALATEAGGGLGVAGAAAAAFVVAAVGAAVVVAELNRKAFEAAEAWSNYGQEIYKAKLITGQTAEQLSVLKIIASETDTPFQELTRTAAKLQVSISKGITEPAGDAGQALKLLRLNTEDFKKATPDQQLQRTAKALNEVTNQGDKNRASMALLSRGYTESAEALHDLGERYTETEERARALGLLMSEEDVAAAHKFDDAMDEIKTGLIALTVQIGERTGPVILAVLDDISRSLGLNENSWRAWGAVIGDVLAATVTGTQRAVRDIMAALAAVSTGNPIGAFLGQDAEERKKQLQILRGSDSQTGIGVPQLNFGSRSQFRGGGRGGGGRAAATTQKISEAQRLLNQLTDEYNKLQAKSDSLTQVQITAQELLKDKYKGTTSALRDQILTEAAQVDRAREAADLAKRKAEATEKIRALLNSQTEAINKERLGEDEWQKQIEALEAELKKLGLTMDDNTRKLLSDNAALQKTLSLTRERIVLTQTLIDRMERQRAVEEKNQLRLIGIDKAEGDETRPRRVFEPTKQTASAIDQLFEHIHTNLSGAQQTAALAGLQAMTSAFDTLGRAVGQAAYAWVLYGKSGTSIRKVTAEILASLAQQALVKSIFELAEGFAALFLNPAEAAAHFTAAGIYASIGGVAALAGRSVAGNVFQQATGTGSGDSGSIGNGTGGSTPPAASPATIREEWRDFHLNLKVKGDALVDGIRENVAVNGPIRNLIIEIANTN